MTMSGHEVATPNTYIHECLYPVSSPREGWRRKCIRLLAHLFEIAICVYAGSIMKVLFGSPPTAPQTLRIARN